MVRLQDLMRQLKCKTYMFICSCGKVYLINLNMYRASDMRVTQGDVGDEFCLYQCTSAYKPHAHIPHLNAFSQRQLAPAPLAVLYFALTLTSRRLTWVFSNSSLVSSSRILASCLLTRDFSTIDCSRNSSWLWRACI